MAALEFVDTHVHFNDFSRDELRWSWLEPDAVHPILGRIDGIKHQRYGPEEFLGETRLANVSKVVHVQAALGSEDPVDETRWLQELHQQTGLPQAIVADAPLQDPDVEAVLAAHVEHDNVRGIRDFGQGEGYLEDPAFHRGYALLSRYGLLFDMDTTWEDMPVARDLARSNPDTTLVVDHCGFPRERTDDYFESWRRAVHELAGAPNVVMKLSGLGMCDPQWTVESFRPWIHECLEAFGVDRCVFATNWPVDRLYSSYTDLVDAYAALVAELRQDEQVALFSSNAERVFDI